MTAQENARIAVDCLGLRLTAFALGVRKTSEVKGMTIGEVTPTTLQAVKLEQLAEWVTTLRKLESDATIRALSMGMWPDLNDEAPIELFHYGQGQRALDAARSYY
jgi:hypothetical protein